MTGPGKRVHNVDSTAVALGVADASDAEVKRGPESWQFLYTVLGFTLTIETSLAGFLPLRWWAKIVLLLVVAIATWALFLHSGGFQNRLMRWKQGYENKFR